MAFDSMNKEQIDLAELELKIRDQLAREYNWNEHERHWQANQEYWKANQDHWRANQDHWRVNDRYWRYTHIVTLIGIAAGFVAAMIKF